MEKLFSLLVPSSLVACYTLSFEGILTYYFLVSCVVLHVIMPGIACSSGVHYFNLNVIVIFLFSDLKIQLMHLEKLSIMVVSVVYGVVWCLMYRGQL